VSSEAWVLDMIKLLTNSSLIVCLSFVNAV
jgi:hypothetical protein